MLTRQQKAKYVNENRGACCPYCNGSAIDLVEIRRSDRSNEMVGVWKCENASWCENTWEAVYALIDLNEIEN